MSDTVLDVGPHRKDGTTENSGDPPKRPLDVVYDQWTLQVILFSSSSHQRGTDRRSSLPWLLNTI